MDNRSLSSHSQISQKLSKYEFNVGLTPAFSSTSSYANVEGASSCQAVLDRTANQAGDFAHGCGVILRKSIDAHKKQCEFLKSNIYGFWVFIEDFIDYQLSNNVAATAIQKLERNRRFSSQIAICQNEARAMEEECDRESAARLT